VSGEYTGGGTLNPAGAQARAGGGPDGLPPPRRGIPALMIRALPALWRTEFERVGQPERMGLTGRDRRRCVVAPGRSAGDHPDLDSTRPDRW